MITETCYITKKNIAFIYYQTFFFVECSEGSYTVGNWKIMGDIPQQIFVW